MRLAVYPGSFDPITRGHLDIIDRAGAVFDRSGRGRSGQHAQDAQPRGDRAGGDHPRRHRGGAGPRVAAGIEVITFEGLTVDLARERGATSIVRGLRALSDFENEQAIAHLNRKLAPDVDTVFFMTGIEHAYLSSSLVREIAAFDGDVSAMVPDSVARRLRERGRS